MAAVLSADELFSVENKISFQLKDRMRETLIRLNQAGKIESLLELLGIQNQYGELTVAKSSKILVIGQSEVKVKVFQHIAKAMGMDKARFEFCLEYKKAKGYNFRHLQYSDKYALVIVGPMPHSTRDKGDFSSVIARMEHEEGYPPIMRTGSNSLSLSKSSFEQALKTALAEGVI